MMRWGVFAGAAVLVVGMLRPYAPMSDVIGGVALAAVIHWKLPQLIRRSKELRRDSRS
jgi:hypothetical protein